MIIIIKLWKIPQLFLCGIVKRKKDIVFQYNKKAQWAYYGISGFYPKIIIRKEVMQYEENADI